MTVTRGVTTDLPIPATAEIVLEGEMVPPGGETRQEGPFGEFTGYYASHAQSEPVVRIKSILHRNNPIIQGNPPMPWPSSHGWFVQMRRSAILWDHLDKQIPGIHGVGCVGAAGGGEGAMALRVAARARAGVIWQKRRAEARRSPLSAKLRQDAHEIVDVVADVGTVLAISTVDFFESFTDERRPPLERTRES